MTRLASKKFSGPAILLAALLAFPLLAAGQVTVGVRDPIAVKVERVYRLPFFCIEEGLQAGRAIRHCPAVATETDWTTPVPDTACMQDPEKLAPCAPKATAGEVVKKPRETPPKTIYVAPGNADDVAKQLQPAATAGAANTGSASASVAAATAIAGTATASATGAGTASLNQFVLTAIADKRSIVIFCRDRACPPPALATMEKAIFDLAKPRFSYFQDYPIHSAKTGKALAKSLPLLNKKLKGEVIAQMTLRVESDQPLNDAELAIFKKQLSKDQAAVEANEIFGTAIPDDVKKDLKGPAADVEVTALDMPYFCQPNDLKTAPNPIDRDKDICAAPARVVQAGNIDAVMQAIAAGLAKGTTKITLSKDGYRLLAACDGKCDSDASQLIQDTISSTARPVPLFVRDVEFPRGTAYIAARTLTAGPLKATELTDSLVRVTSDTPIGDGDWAARLEQVRQKGFGTSQPQPIQRMFYQSAGAVVGDLLTTPPPGVMAALGEDAATPPATSVAPSGGGAPPAASAGATTTTPAGGTTISITNNPAAAATPAAAPSAPAPGPAPTGTLGQGMTAVDDNVVFTDTSSISAIKRRARLLTMLDMPRPEVLMNIWSFQASSPNGREVARTLESVRDLVSANNDALQHAIDYGWGYLSRQMRSPEFFDNPFYKYVTQRFVADTADCESHRSSAADCLSDEDRTKWGFCASGEYCLGYEGAFQPARPSLSSILLAMMASKNTGRAVLTTIGCMEGKFEVYGPECFPDRNDIKSTMPASQSDEATKNCIRTERAKFLERQGAGDARGAEVTPETKGEKAHTLSCELLDRAAVAAQRSCGLTVSLPLSCFTLQAAATFLPDNSFSTFPLQRLNLLAEENLGDLIDSLAPQKPNYSTTGLGLLRSAVADFLFNYKIAIQYPQDMGTYALPHSAQELNARLNPLVIAFNQDVAALSRTLLDEAQREVPTQNSLFELWRHNKSYIANGMITVRGISGVESLVDTDTQNAFDSTQAQALSAILTALTGNAASPAAAGGTNTGNTVTINADGSTASGASGGGAISGCGGASAGTPICSVAQLLKGSTSGAGIATALAAITPTQTHSIIGRQLTLDVIPYTLPGASSAELNVRLWAQEDSPPTIYSASGTTDNDYTSRVARHNVATRVRVESVKLFDVSTFTAMVQRPRTKLPILPPFVEIPLISSLLSVPLPAAKIYHASSAIVSAIIVPTAADLGYGIVFQDDRAVFREDKKFSRLPYTLRVLTDRSQFPETAPVEEFHQAMVKCLATGGAIAYTGTTSGLGCDKLKFSSLPPTR